MKNRIWRNLLIIFAISYWSAAISQSMAAAQGPAAEGRNPVFSAAASFPFSDDFEAGSLGANWSITTTADGQVQVGASTAHSGTYSLLLDDQVEDSVFSTAAAILTIDLAGQTDVVLDFWWREFSDEDHSQDGVFISDDGLTWQQIFSFNGGPSTFGHNIIDLDAAAAAAGLTLTNQFKIKFQFYDNAGLGAATDRDGLAIDQVQVTTSPPYSAPPVNPHQIVVGAYHSCMITAQGALKCWGLNMQGQLGDGSTTNRQTPINVVGLADSVTTMAAGTFHTCALTSGGGVYCWGFNGNGQLGDGTTANKNSPVGVSGLSGTVIDIVAGAGHTCALTGAGGVQCWGRNDYGQLGNGSTADNATPVDVTGLTSGVVQLTAGSYHTCALDNTGAVQCWGHNIAGQLGDGSTTDSHLPVRVQNLASQPAELSAGSYHTCSLNQQGGVQCWGYNFYGQIGDDPLAQRNSPIHVSNFTENMRAIALGYYFTCGLTDSDGLKCLGQNDHGQLGDGTTVDRNSPVDVQGLTSGVAAMSGGFEYACAQTASGGVQCWGQNNFGQLGNNTTSDSSIPIATDGLEGASDSTPPAAVNTLLATTGAVSGTVQLSWSAPGDDGAAGMATRYDVRYAASAIDDETQWAAATAVTGAPAPGSAGSAEQMTVAGLTAGQNYYFAIRAEDEQANLSSLGNSPAAVAKLDAFQPANVTASDGAFTDTVLVSWDPVAGATYYELYRATSAAGVKTLLASPTAASYSDTAALASVAYTYWVKACNLTDCSDFSAADTGWRQLTAPITIDATDGAFTDTVQVIWSAVVSATSYEVYRADSPTGAKSKLSSPTQTSYNDGSAGPGTVYYYWLKACAATGCSAFSGSDAGWRQLTAPAAVAASDGDFTDKVQITWSNMAGATYYELYRATSATGVKTLLASPTGLTYDDTSAVAGVTYFYWLKACAAAGCSAFSGSDAGWLQSDIPANVAASDGDFTDKIQVTWAAVSGATYYELYRATSDTGVKTLLASPTVTSYDDTSAVAGVTYFYWLKACDSNGCSAFSGSDAGWRQLTAPAAVAASDGDFTDKVQITWSNMAGATYYELYRATSATGVKTLLASPIGLTYDDTSAVAGVTYFYWLKACDSNGCSAFSGSDAGWLQSDIPANVAASDGDFTDKVQVTWAAVSGATYYELYRATSDSGVKTLLASPTVTSYDDTSAAPGVTYFYWLKACDSNGCSAFSSSDAGWLQSTTPANVAASDGLFTTQIQVTWAAATGATAYEVYRALSPTDNKFKLATTTALFYDDLSAAPGLLYYYWVKACDSNGCSAFSGYDTGAVAISFDAKHPATGSALIEPALNETVTTNPPLFDWFDATGAISYTWLLTKTEAAAAAQATVTQITTTESSYQPAAELAAGVYRWTVQAHDTLGYTTGYEPEQTFVVTSSEQQVYLPLVIK